MADVKLRKLYDAYHHYMLNIVATRAIVLHRHTNSQAHIYILHQKDTIHLTSNRYTIHLGMYRKQKKDRLLFSISH